MNSRTVAPIGEQPSPANDLARLIETEERLGQTLSSATEEAAHIVVTAREAAAAAEAELDRELAQERQQLASAVEREGAQRAAEMVADAGRAAARLDAIPEKRITELAGLVLERLLKAEEAAP